MKILHLVALSAVLMCFCYSDPVNCSQIQGSPIGKIASCTSLHPFPLKVTSTVTLTMSYAWQSWSWTFFLRNYKGQMMKVDGCIIINPTYAAYNIGANLTIGITCYELPRQLTQGDYIHINFFAQQAAYKLVFLIPILGYSSIQSIRQNELTIKTQNNQLQDPVQCIKIHPSKGMGIIQSCTSVHPFPLKVTSTIVITSLSAYDFNNKSWIFYLRNYKGELTKVDGCIITNPTFTLYFPGKRLTIGIVCYQLPRQLTTGDYIQISFFDDQRSDQKLIYLIPILGYNSNYIKTNQITLNQQNKQLQDPVDCVQVQGSWQGYFSSCTTVHPFPLKVSSTIVLKTSYYFKNNSWQFYLRSYKGQLTKVSGCIISNPTFDVYSTSSKLTLGIICYQLPRQLTQGDYIHIIFFDDQNAQDKLIYLIPILGYSSYKITPNQIQIHQNQLSQTVQCQTVQNSYKAAYVNCTSTKPFPLRVTTTMTLLKDNAFIASTDWRFWLRQAKGQIMKVNNCTLSNPPSGSYKKGDNITVGITCYELPRELKQWDSIQVTFFQVDNLTYLIPITGYNAQIQKNHQIEEMKNHQVEYHLVKEEEE